MRNKLLGNRRIVIVDDQNLFASGFEKLLENIPKTEVVSVFENGDNLIEYMHILSPHVIFLDLNMPGKNGLELASILRKEFPELIIAVLTMYQDKFLIKRVKELNANAFLSKDATIEDIEKTISLTHDSDFYISESLNSCSSENKALPIDSFIEIALITKRENEIIKLIIDGKSTVQISNIICVSRETVKTHRKNIFKKLNINKVSELVKFAYENSLI